MNLNQSYSYSDIFLKPTQKSEIERRGDVDTSTTFLGRRISLPIILAPMQTVVGQEMAEVIDSLEGISFLPRTDDSYQDYAIYEELLDLVGPERVIPSIPAVNGLVRVRDYISMGADSVCVDLANGFSIVAERAVEEIQDKFPDIKIITGNVGSLEGYKFLSDLGVAAVRCSIGSGSVCSTATQTSIHSPVASLIREIATYREAQSLFESMPVIIADGGISSAGDLVKAISLGADVVMIGGLFGQTTESPGPVLTVDGKEHKQMAGQASFQVKQTKSHIEGKQQLVPHIGPVKDLWNSLKDGLSSGMSYLNCKNIEGLKFLPDENFGFLSAGAKTERMVQK